ncbi:MAG: hypothetical protein KC912_18345 [Proteobacteria bacterium]|nr:hypothetical protein [Pseudomonadota bacterium]
MSSFALRSVTLLLLSAPAWAVDVPCAPECGEAADEAVEKAPASAWLRFDTDGLGTQLWVGATHALGPVAVASDIYLAGTYAELDVGVALSAGSVSVTPMLGFGFDFDPKVQSAAALVPQLYTIASAGPVYFESWIQVFVSSPFAGTDSLYTRDFMLFGVGEHVQLGPQAEFTLGLGDGAISSLPVGGRVNLAYGERNTLGLFLAHDVVAEGTGGVTGRATFVRTF